ncbi:hypothetical protein TRIUR3_29023 [Triticum urartu]|uniref:Uncharacterized protein n=1 Tax=Triticum urartu TaxID=4572 RepID=M7ZHT7_TRIUA|nr:hypothetical protein TRIUR3_29023 [Triticum urartu]
MAQASCSKGPAQGTTTWRCFIDLGFYNLIHRTMAAVCIYARSGSLLIQNHRSNSRRGGLVWLWRRNQWRLWRRNVLVAPEGTARDSSSSRKRGFVGSGRGQLATETWGDSE